MFHDVLLTDDAAQDLEEIFHYVQQHDVDGKADYLLLKIEAALKMPL